MPIERKRPLWLVIVGWNVVALVAVLALPDDWRMPAAWVIWVCLVAHIAMRLRNSN
jgi:hypothetical protein